MEHNLRYNTAENFLTYQTFDDITTSIDGLLLYIVKLIGFPKAAVVPWLLNSDPNEQLFGRIRTGQYLSRRSNIDPIRIPQSMGKYNILLNIESR